MSISQLPMSLDSAPAADVPFRAVIADSAGGHSLELKRALIRADAPHVLAHHGAVARCSAPADVAHSF